MLRAATQDLCCFTRPPQPPARVRSRVDKRPSTSPCMSTRVRRLPRGQECHAHAHTFGRREQQGNVVIATATGDFSQHKQHDTRRAKFSSLGMLPTLCIFIRRVTDSHRGLYYCRHSLLLVQKGKKGVQGRVRHGISTQEHNVLEDQGVLVRTVRAKTRSIERWATRGHRGCAVINCSRRGQGDSTGCMCVCMRACARSAHRS